MCDMSYDVFFGLVISGSISSLINRRRYKTYRVYHFCGTSHQTLANIPHRVLCTNPLCLLLYVFAG